MTIAFVFPGQGAQYVGMGVSIAERDPRARALFERAGQVLGFDLLALCASGPAEDLRATENSQPAILVTGLACAAALTGRGIPPGLSAGLSLGEYGALVLADAIGFEDAVAVVRERGRLMREAAGGRKTAMAALIGLSADTVDALCAAHRHLGVVEPANFNGAGQVVIGGDAAAVHAAAAAARAWGARRVTLLAVSAPFHTSLMAPAADRLAAVLERVELRDARFPVVANATGRPVRAADEIRRLLVRQVAAAVRWEACMHELARLGGTTFIEVGPGRTLSGLIRKTLEAQTLHVEDGASLDRTLEVLRGARASAGGAGAPGGGWV